MGGRLAPLEGCEKVTYGSPGRSASPCRAHFRDSPHGLYAAQVLVTRACERPRQARHPAGLGITRTPASCGFSRLDQAAAAPAYPEPVLNSLRRARATTVARLITMAVAAGLLFAAIAVPTVAGIGVLTKTAISNVRPHGRAETRPAAGPVGDLRPQGPPDHVLLPERHRPRPGDLQPDRGADAAGDRRHRGRPVLPARRDRPQGHDPGSDQQTSSTRPCRAGPRWPSST